MAKEDDGRTTAAQQTQAIAPRPRAEISFGGHGMELKSLDEAWRFSQLVYKSGFAPYGFDSPERVMVAVEMGLELGIPPMMAIQNIGVINGKPGVYGDITMALIRRGGAFDESSYKEWFSGKPFDDDYTAHCQMRRLPDGHPFEATFSVAQARLAGLWGKKSAKGAPSPWVLYPGDMLMWKARARASRPLFAAELKGMAMLEDLQGEAPPKQFVVEQVEEPTTLDELSDFMESRTPPRKTAETYDPETGEVHEDEDVPIGQQQELIKTKPAKAHPSEGDLPKKMEA